MTNNRILLALGIILLGVGILKPNFNLFNINSNRISTESYVVDAPSDDKLLQKAREVIDVLKQSDDSTKTSECLKLSSMYADMATLIELDGEDTIIKDTSTIKEANSLCGKMLRLNIKNKYPNLAETSREVIIAAVGDDDILLDDKSRIKAVEAFRALSWAFYEGSK